jgi:hypothetical protein
LIHLHRIALIADDDPLRMIGMVFEKMAALQICDLVVEVPLCGL